MHRAHHRFRRAADADPDLQRLAERRVNLLRAERRAVAAGPCQLRVAQRLREKIEFLVEEDLVVAEFVPEEREAFGEGTAAEDDLARPSERAFSVENR
jgi:hypothetical protein